MKTWLSGPMVRWAVAGVALLVTGSAVTALLLGQAGCSTSGQASPQPGDKGKPASPAPTGGQQGPAVLKTVRPRREHLRHQVKQPATVVPYEQTDIFAKVSGYLRVIHVDIGDLVEKDQVLAELSIPELEQNVLQKKAALEQARADLTQADAAQRVAEALVEAAQARLKQLEAEVLRHAAEEVTRRSEHQRYELLYRDRTATEAQLEEKLNWYRAAQASHLAAKAAVLSAGANIKTEQARVSKAVADVKSAHSRIQLAQANLDEARTIVAYGTITAPYRGRITRRNVHTGAFIQSAATSRPEPLLTIMRVDKVRVVAPDIPADEAAWVKVGQRATFEAKGLLQKPSGTVARITDALDLATRSLRAEVELDQLPKGLRLGMFGYVTITVVDDPKALLVPVAAVVPGEERPVVLGVESGRIVRREVELGFSDGVQVQILRGLSGDEQVVADGRVPGGK
jgi:multidrug efflux pump subunit AcrA (membrane-fusion protein)